MPTVQSADGTKLAYDRVGDGPPLIVVTGALSDRAAPRGLAATLAPDFTVFTYDRRGRGDSGDTLPYAVEREIEDLDAMIAEAGGTANVFAHSSGAVLALEAAMSGSPITKLVAYEPPYIVDETRDRPEQLGDRVRALVDAGAPGDGIKLFLAEGPQLPPGAIAGIEGSPGWPNMLAMAKSVPYDLAICGDQHAPLERLARITVPTLLVSGGESPAWARNTVDAVAAAIGAEHVSLPGQTHGAADDVLAPVLVKFLAR